MSQTKPKHQLASNWHWLAAGVLSQFLYLPISIFVKMLINDLEPAMITVVRYALASLIFLPFVIYGVYKHRHAIRRNLKTIILSVLIISINPILYYMALSMAEVSFVAILHMFGPIIFTILSVLIVKDKVSHQAKFGLFFAFLGGIVILVLPLLLGSGKVLTFGWLPVVLSAVAVITTQLDVVFCRKINENGVPLPVIAGLGLVGIFIVGLAVALFNGGFEALNVLANLPLGDWWLLIYIAIVGSVLGSLLPVKVYEKIGTASQATIDYLYYVLMILLPVLIFSETLSWEMIVGAVLVMAGIILTRVHHKHHPHSRSRQ